MRSSGTSNQRLLSRSPLAAAIALSVAALLVFSAARIVTRAWSIYRERDAVTDHIRAFESEKKRLEDAMSAAGSRETVERLAKEGLNMKLPGEEVVVVSGQVNASPATAPSLSSRLIPFWVRELVAFFGR